MSVKFYRKVPNARRELSVISLPVSSSVGQDAVLYRTHRRIRTWIPPGNALAALVAAPCNASTYLAHSAASPVVDADHGRVSNLPYLACPHPATGSAKNPRVPHDPLSVSIHGLVSAVHVLFDH